MRIALATILVFTLQIGICQSPRISIAAASDVKFALDSIISMFKRQTGAEVMVTYGSSGKLFEQISNGAPFDIFFSADLVYPEMLEKNGLASASAEIYGTGRLVIWSKVVNPSVLQERSFLDTKISRISIANPKHAPYGKRAIEFLQFFKLYEKIKSKLVYGENISQASQYLYSGAADIGIIALSLALSPPMQKLGGKYFLIPEQSHTPLLQAFVLLKSGAKNETVLQFYRMFKSEESTAVLRHNGFVVPGEITK